MLTPGQLDPPKDPLYLYFEWICQNIGGEWYVQQTNFIGEQRLIIVRNRRFQNLK